MGHQPQTSTKKPAARRPADPASAHKREILAQLKGPVARRLQELIPALAGVDDVYKTVMETPELLHGCLQVFHKERAKFQEFLVDAAGRPVTDDDAKLRCDRSVNEIIGMVVRSGARAYAEKRFGAPEKRPRPLVRKETQGLLQKLAALVTGKWSHEETPKAKASYADEFYAAIKDQLEYDWQVPLIPHYAELPARLIAELGKGLTTLRTPEGIAALANIGRHNLDEARRILSDEMMREMLDNQPLAAQGIAFLGKAKYEYMYEAVYGKMGVDFWHMCTDTDRLEAMEDKNAKDLQEMARYLHIIGADTINYMIQRLEVYQLAIFLEVAWHTLGEERFRAVFGVPGSPPLIKRFTEKAAAFKLDPENPAADFQSRLPSIFQAYLLSAGPV